MEKEKSASVEIINSFFIRHPVCRITPIAVGNWTEEFWKQLQYCSVTLRIIY
jgi:hypothetical protein